MGELKMDASGQLTESWDSLPGGRIYRTVIENIEKTLIEQALERSLGNQILASKYLGLNRNTFRTKIKNLNIKIEKYRA